MEKFSKCKACGAKIRWIKMYHTGTYMPVDADMRSFIPDQAGPDTFVSQFGQVTKGRMSPPVRGSIAGYVPHFATCTDPGSFRKRGKESEGGRKKARR